MVMEYVSSGNLKDLLETKEEELGLNDLLDMIYSACCGMEYLERYF
jgi:serine/threonine protein kinase